MSQLRQLISTCVNVVTKTRQRLQPTGADCVVNNMAAPTIAHTATIQTEHCSSQAPAMLSCVLLVPMAVHVMFPVSVSMNGRICSAVLAV